MESESRNHDERIFPLPLAPFEAYMLADHRHDYPMHFYFRMVFRGRLDRDVLTRSLSETIERHPLLRAKIRPRFGRTPVWESQPDVCLCESLHAFDDLSEVRQTPGIDLQTEPGLRTWVFDEPSQTQLLFEFHHSCCDGLGALLFLEDLLVSYHGMVDGTEIRVRNIRDSELSSRDVIPLTAGQAIQKIPLDVQDFFRILLRRPAMVADAVNEPDNGSHELSSFLSHEFSSPELTALLAIARTQSATLNSIIMKEVYRALDQWMSDNGDTADRWIRMGIPASTRTGDSPATTCCNQVTIMFLDQHSRDIRRPDSLLDRITQQTKFHRSSNIWYTMLQLLKFLAAVPPLLRLYLRTNRRMCTTILSNVGRVFESCPLPRNNGRLVVGGTELQAIEFFSPLRPGTDVTFGVVTYAGALRLCMHYKPHRIGASPAAELMQHVVRNIQESARSPRQP